MALLRLDTDWYKSTMHEFENLYAKISTGGIIICDDYTAWGRDRKAIDEYFRERVPSDHYAENLFQWASADKVFLKTKIDHELRGSLGGSNCQRIVNKIYRANLDQPRDVNSDITDWDIWLYRAWDETVARQEELPLHYEMIRRPDPMRLDGGPPGLEFYDLEVDPSEMTNQADSPDYAGATERLRESLRSWALDTGDAYTSLTAGADG